LSHAHYQQGSWPRCAHLANAWGLLECTLFPPVYRRLRGVTASPALENRLVRATGEPEDQCGAVTLTVERLETFQLFGG